MKKGLRLLGKGTAFFMASIAWVILCIVYAPEPPALWRLWAEAIPLLGVLVTTWLFWRFVDKRRFPLKGKGNLLQSTLLGIITGCLWFGLAFGILLLYGGISITGFQAVSDLWIWILAVLLNAAMQELLVRGYLYKMLEQNAGTTTAVISTTALFTLLHGGAFSAGWVAVMNVLTMSLMMTVMMMYTDSLWSPILAHFIWNCLGGVILGGVSLAEDYPHLWNVAFSGPDWLSGSVYKMEGSVVVLCLNVAFIGLYVLGLKNKRKKYVFDSLSQ